MDLFSLLQQFNNVYIIVLREKYKDLIFIKHYAIVTIKRCLEEIDRVKLEVDQEEIKSILKDGLNKIAEKYPEVFDND